MVSMLRVKGDCSEVGQNDHDSAVLARFPRWRLERALFRPGKKVSHMILQALKKERVKAKGSSVWQHEVSVRVGRAERGIDWLSICSSLQRLCQDGYLQMLLAENCS